VSYSSAIERVERYYSEKLERHGPTPQGVDWNGDQSQIVRFQQLLRVIDDQASVGFSINDYGCGYGALVDQLAERYGEFAYTGYDVSAAMVDEAQRRYEPETRATFTSNLQDLEPADFTVASGVFNVKLATEPAEWRQYIGEMIAEIARLSTRGMAFNALTSHTDPGRRRDDLYYADPADLLDHCLRNHSRDVVLLHDYELFEFTLLVRLEGRQPAAREELE
jgi:SAM-dependent methyltransferase